MGVSTPTQGWTLWTLIFISPSLALEASGKTAPPAQQSSALFSTGSIAGLINFQGSRTTQRRRSKSSK
jgi:hypothetical protein